MRALTVDRRGAANLLTATLTDITLGLGKVRLDVVGEEHLWSARPAVFIWNHRNILDAQIVGRLVQRDFGAVAGKELEHVPLFAAASRFLPITFIDRATAARPSRARAATRLLGEGVSMLVAPRASGWPASPSGRSRRARSAWRWRQGYRSCRS